MKNSNLRKALQDIKQAKSLAERVTAATVFINKTAYKTGRLLYDGISTPVKALPSPKTTSTEPVTPTLIIEPIYSEAPAGTIIIDSLNNEAGAAEPLVKEQLPPANPPLKLDPFSEALLRFDTEIKSLRHAHEQALTEVDKNVIHFKILRLTRQRREYLDQSRNT